jgi:transcriptional regulator with XRE-family HTH domain
MTVGYNLRVSWEARDAIGRPPEVQRGMDRIGRAINRQRHRIRATQTELGHLTGIDQSTISRIERGQRGLRWSTFARLVEALGGLDFREPRDDPNGWMFHQAEPNPYFARLEAERARAAAARVDVASIEAPAAEAAAGEVIAGGDHVSG